MGLLRRLSALFFPNQQEPSTATSSSIANGTATEFPEGWGALGAVGESQYQPALKRVAETGRICWATLVPEPENPFDPSAVVVKIQGEIVAYLSRNDARRYFRRLRTLETPIEVPAKLIGGTRDKPSFGVLLDCRRVEELPSPKRTP